MKAHGPQIIKGSLLGFERIKHPDSFGNVNLRRFAGLCCAITFGHCGLHIMQSWVAPFQHGLRGMGHFDLLGLFHHFRGFGDRDS